VSTAGVALGGSRWRQDGREIFYVSGLPDRRLMATDVAIKGGTLEVGAARSLFDLVDVAGFSSFDVSADGQRFLLLSAPEQQSAEPLTLIQNWASALKK
jgi:hypothetical protein